MAVNFYTLITTTGKAKMANAAALGTKVNFKTLKVGDGNGNYYEPTENQTNLLNTVWQGSIGSISIDENNSNWIVTETTIPATDGGFFIREAGIFDEDGDLIAISKMAETYKPVAAEGSTKNLIVQIILEVSNSSSVTLKIDPNVVIATKNDIAILTNSINSITTQFSEKANIESPSFTGTVKTEKNTLDDGSGNMSVAKDINLSGGSIINTSNNEIEIRVDNSTAKQGLFANNGGVGFYDWLNNRNIMIYDKAVNATSFNHGGNLYLNEHPILSALSGGYKVQSGIIGITATANTTGSTTLTFPSVFSSAPIVLVSMGGSSISRGDFVEAEGITTSSAVIFYNYAVAGSKGISWVAIGN